MTNIPGGIHRIRCTTPRAAKLANRPYRSSPCSSIHGSAGDRGGAAAGARAVGSADGDVGLAAEDSTAASTGIATPAVLTATGHSSELLPSRVNRLGTSSTALPSSA